MNVFLVPASPQNVAKTLNLKERVDFEDAAQFLDRETVRGLEDALGGRHSFHCWGVTDGPNKRIFKKMSPGDELLFTKTGSRLFQLWGEVKTTFECEMLGRKLWPPHEGQTGIQNKRREPWKYIYVIDNLRAICLNKRLVLERFGYQNQNDNL
jgi:hypothetical protein